MFRRSASRIGRAALRGTNTAADGRRITVSVDTSRLGRWEREQRMRQLKNRWSPADWQRIANAEAKAEALEREVVAEAWAGRRGDY